MQSSVVTCARTLPTTKGWVKLLFWPQPNTDIEDVVWPHQFSNPLRGIGIMWHAHAPHCTGINVDTQGLQLPAHKFSLYMHSGLYSTPYIPGHLAKNGPTLDAVAIHAFVRTIPPLRASCSKVTLLGYNVSSTHTVSITMLCCVPDSTAATSDPFIQSWVVNSCVCCRHVEQTILSAETNCYTVFYYSGSFHRLHTAQWHCGVTIGDQKLLTQVLIHRSMPITTCWDS